MDTTSLLIIAVLIGLLPAAIAKSKGHNFYKWWFLGAVMFIIALPAAILLKPDVKGLEKQQLETGGMKKCPYCAEMIKAEAAVCRFCGRELSAVEIPTGPAAGDSAPMLPAASQTTQPKKIDPIMLLMVAGIIIGLCVIAAALL